MLGKVHRSFLWLPHINIFIKLFYLQKENTKGKWSHSVVSDSVIPWTVVHQAPPSMGFSRQEYWSGVPFPSPGDLPDPGTEPGSPALQADALLSEPPGKSTEWYLNCELEAKGALWGRKGQAVDVRLETRLRPTSEFHIRESLLFCCPNQHQKMSYWSSSFIRNQMQKEHEALAS